ncbi:MAG: TPM domain-containing protein [Bacteroidota bacterium]
MSLKTRFSQGDLDRIKAAVKEAESKISGEIVPVFVERSGHYAIATYRGALGAAALAFLLIVFFDRYVPTLAVYDPLLIFTLVLLAGSVGAMLVQWFDPVKKWMLSQEHLDQATRKKAETVFLEEEVFNTRQRTGILIFISFFEHEVIVMADKGISKEVDQKEWDNLVKIIIEHIRKGKIVEGMELAIKRSGEILLEKGFVITPDDVNELGDELRVE